MKSPTDKEWKEFQERVKEKNQERNIVGVSIYKISIYLKGSEKKKKKKRS